MCYGIPVRDIKDNEVEQNAEKGNAEFREMIQGVK